MSNECDCGLCGDNCNESVGVICDECECLFEAMSDGELVLLTACPLCGGEVFEVDAEGAADYDEDIGYMVVPGEEVEA